MGKKVNINIEKLEDALKNIKARFECEQIAHMKEITSSSFYVNGMYRVLSMGNDTFITRFNNPEELTLNDILKLADLTDTDPEIIPRIAFRKARQQHKKYDLSHLK